MPRNKNTIKDLVSLWIGRTAHHDCRDLSRWTREVDIVENPLSLLGQNKTTGPDPRQAQPSDLDIDLLPHNVHVALRLQHLFVGPSSCRMLDTTWVPILTGKHSAPKFRPGAFPQKPTARITVASALKPITSPIKGTKYFHRGSLAGMSRPANTWSPVHWFAARPVTPSHENTRPWNWDRAAIRNPYQ